MKGEYASLALGGWTPLPLKQAHSQRKHRCVLRRGRKNYLRTLNIYNYQYLQSECYRLKRCSTAYENAPKYSISTGNNQNFRERRPSLNAFDVLFPRNKILATRLLFLAQKASRCLVNTNTFMSYGAVSATAAACKR